MKKRVLSLILCVLMLVPCLAMIISADDTSSEEVIRENVATYGLTYHTSVWNGDRSAKFLNNGVLYSDYANWEPNSVNRPGGSGVNDRLQWVGMKFNDYYEADEMTLYVKRWGTENGGFCPNCRVQFTTAQLTNIQYKDGKPNEIESATCPNCVVDEVPVRVQLTSNARNNIKYTVKALVLGEWVTLGVAYNNDAEYYVENGKVVGGNLATLTIKFYEHEKTADNLGTDEECVPNFVLDENGNKIPFKANTKNIRIYCSKYGAYAEGKDPNDKSAGGGWHDWWLVPQLHEVILMGNKGYTPPFDVPEGAVLSTNAALGGFASATSSYPTRNPALGNDDMTGTYWRAELNGGGQEYWVDFASSYLIDDITLNFGGMNEANTGIQINYTLSVKKGNSWVEIAKNQNATTTDTVITNANKELLVKHIINDSGIAGVKITFNSVKKNGADIRAVLTEVAANIRQTGNTATDKCIFYSDFMTVAKKTSTAAGNLACYGEAYVSSAMDYASISEKSYINDGLIGDDDFSWFAQTFAAGAYAGVVLREAHTITKVVLYFNDPVTGGNPQDHVMTFDVQVKMDGKFVTVAKGSSYDTKTKKSIVSVSVPNVYTDDIRIVYTSNGKVFPYLKELEVYADQEIYSPYVGYQIDTSRTMYGLKLTQNFSEKSYARRSSYLNLTSPLEYFNITQQYGIEVQNWQ